MYELFKYRDRSLRENAECAAQADQPAHLRRRRARTAAQLTAQPGRKTDHLLDDHCRATHVVVNASGCCEGLDDNAQCGRCRVGSKSQSSSSRHWLVSGRAVLIQIHPLKLWTTWQRKRQAPIALRSGPRATKKELHQKILQTSKKSSVAAK